MGILKVLLTTIALVEVVSSRAVNISNTWMLPEEGFPVFYRYFRDRISWYEADAVCQFHHANLVTVDTTSQYDAIRAYLKELDITDNVWIGLSKSADKPDFTWANSRPMSGEGYWQEAIPTGNEALCAAMDPAADFWWKPQACGGPSVASFICELPVPSWAMGPGGCLLTELPSLTVLYNPEQSALELTSDCGLDGTKRIACKGNVDRDEIMRQLTCTISNEDFDDKATRQPTQSSNIESSQDISPSMKTTKPWIWTSNTIETEYGTPTRHRRETEETMSPTSTKSTTETSTTPKPLVPTTKLKNAQTTSSFHDVTLESSVTEASNSKGDDGDASPIAEASTETSAGKTETAETKVAETQSEDVGEYPSAINQGQLFSIIENGTMFNIVELNATVDELKPINEAITKDFEISPPSSTEFPAEVHVNSKKDLSLTKEVEAAPIINDPSPKLNRTFRKMVPLVENPNFIAKTEAGVTEDGTTIQPTKSNTDDANMQTRLTIIDTTTVVYQKEPPQETPYVTYESLKIAKQTPEVNNEISDNDVRVFDKTLSKDVEMYSGIPNLLIKLNKTSKKVLKENIEDSKPAIVTTAATLELVQEPKSNSVEDILIDPKIEDLNANFSENNESEIFIPTPTKVSSERLQNKEDKTLTKSAIEEQKVTATEEPLEPIPQPQPKPNRKRQLTRPQSRSFYPYFFSRVLG